MTSYPKIRERVWFIFCWMASCVEIDFWINSDRLVVDALQHRGWPAYALIGFPHLLHGGVVVLRPDEIADGTDDALPPCPSWDMDCPMTP